MATKSDIKNDSKLGLQSNRSDGGMGKWPMPNPQAYTPESAPAKPKGGVHESALANKHSYSSSVNQSAVSGFKSKW